MALATNHGPSADDFYTGGGKRRGMGNTGTRNFLTDAFLGRTTSVAPATQFMQVPPPIPQPQQEYYSHAGYYPQDSVGRKYVRRKRRGSHSRRKRRHHYSLSDSSSDSSSPESRKRSFKPRDYSSSKCTDGDNNELINID